MHYCKFPSIIGRVFCDEHRRPVTELTKHPKRTMKKSKIYNECKELFEHLPDCHRLQAVRAMKHNMMPALCAKEVAELSKKIESLDAEARSCFIRECEEICRESEAFRTRIIRTNGRNKRMILSATGLSPTHKGDSDIRINENYPRQ